MIIQQDKVLTINRRREVNIHLYLYHTSHVELLLARSSGDSLFYCLHLFLFQRENRVFIGLQTTLDTKVEPSKDAIQAVNRIAMKLLCFWSLSGQTKQVRGSGSTAHCFYSTKYNALQ